MLNDFDTEDFAPVVAPIRAVLIVEDDGLLAMMMEDLVRAEGATQIHTSRSAAAALKLVTTDPLDCAILDVSMQGGPTYEVADSLAARGIPFLFCTGLARADIDARHRDRPLLAKPYGDEQFRACLMEALGRQPPAMGR